MKKVKILLLLTCTYLNTFAAFKEIYYTARAASMGSAFVAVSDDVDALVFNPAGITQVRLHELNFTYSKLFYGLQDVDLSTNFLGYIFPVEDIGSFGMLLCNFNSSNYQENVISMYYAKNIKEKISLGLGIKYLFHKYILDERSKVDPVFLDAKDNKDNFTLDLGVLIAVNRKFNLGISAKNLTQPDMGLKSQDVVPIQLRAGVKYTVSRIFSLRDTCIALDVSYRMQEYGSETDKTNLAFGVESQLTNFLITRLGANLTEASLGFSIVLPQVYNVNFKLNYAFLFPFELNSTLGTHRLSVVLQFGR